MRTKINNQEQNDNLPSISNRYVFVDTCIVVYSDSKQQALSEAVLQCLAGLAQKYRLAISEITSYEFLRGLWGSEADKAEIHLQRYEAKVVSRAVLIFASLLEGLYREEKIVNIQDADIIIAATAFLETGYILTSNHKDFPSPFFLPEDFFILPVSHAHYTHHVAIGLYKANTELIRKRIEEYDQKHTPKRQEK